MSAVGYYRMGYENYIPTATISSSSEAAGFPDDNVADLDRNTGWKAGATGTQYMIFDMGTARACDLLAILGGTCVSSGVIITLYVGSVDNGTLFDISLFTWSTVGGGSVDSDHFQQFASYSRRYWKLQVFIFGTIPILGEVWLGPSVSLGFCWPDDKGKDHGVTVVESEGGYAYGEQYSLERKEFFLRSNAGDLTDAEMATLLLLDAYCKNGLRPVVLMDVDTESASGLAIYVRLQGGPMRWSRVFLDANNILLEFKQEL